MAGGVTEGTPGSLPGTWGALSRLPCSSAQPHPGREVRELALLPGCAGGAAGAAARLGEPLPAYRAWGFPASLRTVCLRKGPELEPAPGLLRAAGHGLRAAVGKAARPAGRPVSALW